MSFEPGVAARTQPLRNISLNGLTNVAVHDCALGSDAGEAVLYNINSENDGQSTLSASEGAEFERVRIETLDSIIQDRSPAIVKIDVEGAEAKVIRGGERFFEHTRPQVVFVECFDP